MIDDQKLEQLKYATAWQVEIGKILSSFDPVLRPLEDMAKHGITLATVLLGTSASVIGGLGTARGEAIGYNYLMLGAWLGFIVAGLAGSIQLYRISSFREEIRKFCHMVLGDNPSPDDRKRALVVMRVPQKSALLAEYLTLMIGTLLLVAWAIAKAVLVRGAHDA